MSPFTTDLSVSPSDSLVGFDDTKFVVSYRRFDENFLPYGDYEGQHDISGRGPVSRSDCGTFHGAFKHQLLNKFKSRRFTCHRQGCPECFRTWAVMYSDRLRAFLDACSRLAGFQWWHCTYMPDPEGMEYSEGIDWDAMLADCLDFMREWHDPLHGALAYCYVRHPRVLKCGNTGIDGNPCNFAPETHVLPNVCPACKLASNWKWYVKPHLHFVTNFLFKKAYAGCAMLSLKVKNHAVFVNISKKKGMPPLRGESLRHVLGYEIGHALWEASDGRGTGRKAINYGGAIGRRAVVRVDSKSRVNDTDEDNVPYEQVEADSVPGGYHVHRPIQLVLKNGATVVKTRVEAVCEAYFVNQTLPPRVQALLAQRKRKNAISKAMRAMSIACKGVNVISSPRLDPLEEWNNLQEAMRDPDEIDLGFGDHV